jgi:hypothetical protein
MKFIIETGVPIPQSGHWLHTLPFCSLQPGESVYIAGFTKNSARAAQRLVNKKKPGFRLVWRAVQEGLTVLGVRFWRVELDDKEEGNK